MAPSQARGCADEQTVDRQPIDRDADGLRWPVTAMALR
jgi:hypothetical protein